MLEIGRGNRTQPFNLRFHREPPVVPREMRFEVAERIDGAGDSQCGQRRRADVGKCESRPRVRG